MVDEQMSRLQKFEEEVARLLAELYGAVEPWSPKQPDVDHDVLIVGAGQSGIAAAFALRRKGIQAAIIDAEEEGREGVWLERAHMPTLRTPKDRPGPELGIAPLSFKSWFIANNDERTYAEMVRIPRASWAEYLSWFRKVLAVQIRFSTRLESIHAAGDNLSVTLDDNGVRLTETTRKLVLATGLIGGGTRNIPTVIIDNLPRHLYSHTDEPIEFTSLQGKNIGVLGASASGFDVAGTALEHGAASARLFCRAADLAHGTRYRWADYVGADYFHLLPDDDRWNIAKLYLERGSHPPPSSIERAARFQEFTLHLGSPWDQVKTEAGKIIVNAKGETFTFDFVIAATGFVHDPRLCPEFSEIADQICLWRDRFTPPPDDQDAILMNYPYLGPEFQYQEKNPGTAPFVRNIHVLNTAALLSHLRIVGDIKCLGFTSEKLASGIARDLFLTDKEHHLKLLASPIREELTGEEYENLIWHGPR